MPECLSSLLSLFLFLGLWGFSHALLKELSSESAAVEKLKEDKMVAKFCDAEEASTLIARGWWAAARKLVSVSHEVADKQSTSALASVVRRDVNDLKLKADALLLALSTQDPDKVSAAQCAFQWSQNSSALFLQIKFSHRWSSPGALAVTKEKVEVSSCCFNFTAEGTHSQLRKRYVLNLGFLHEVDPDRWSWNRAAAGRMTVEIRKKEPAKWKQLLGSKEKVKQMGAWDSMDTRWAGELADFKAWKRKQEKKAKGETSGDEEVDEAEEEAALADASQRCVRNRESPFKSEPQIDRLCEDYWPPRMKGKGGAKSTWLVLFHSPSAMGCGDRKEQCTSVRDKWVAISNKMQHLDVAKIGAVDCDMHKDFCTKQEAGHMPFVRRYRDGKRKPYYGEWEIDSLMKLVQG